MALNAEDFSYIRELVNERSGIILEPGKEYLVESRMLPLINQEGIASIADLVALLRKQSYNDIHQKVVEAMTTNETSFFRDVHPFEALKKEVIPDLVAKRNGTHALNIWCAASSTGQEPYSVVMLLRENFPQMLSWNIQFIASDLSNAVLKRCRDGNYTQLEINRGLPASLMVKFFQRNGMEWQIKDELRKMIDFREINLTQEWGLMPQMDIIFIRNVLIYFDVEMKKKILDKIYEILKPDGYLFMGAAETTINLDDRFTRMQFSQSGCYKKII